METLYGANNWRLTIRRESDHVEILRGTTCDARAALPNELFGLPVTVLGDHALTPGAAPVNGEEIRVIAGRDGDWDNRNLTELTLPEGLTDVRNYGLYGCRNLRTLHLHDRIDRWGGGCLVNCGALRFLHLTRTGERQGEALAFLCGEIQDELDVTIYETDGAVTRLLFPGFTEDYRENFPNHHFDYAILGGGYPYHHVFSGKQLTLHAYDELWNKYLREQYEPETAMRLAYMRLRWPNRLEPFARDQYLAYLRRHTEAAIVWQLTQRDAEGLQLLLRELNPEGSVIHRACEQARREEHTEALALLLEQRRERDPRGLTRSFEL